MSEMLPLDPDALMEGRGEGPIGKRTLVFRETDSTNDLLLKMGEGREPEGTAIFALSQTKGRGRHGHAWASAPGLGLWFSFLLRPAFHPELSAELTAFVALAVQAALREEFALNSGIKAPNDIYVSSRKIAGILTETRVGKSSFAVVGLGINIKHEESDFPSELRGTATSIQSQTGKETSLQDSALVFLRSLNAFYSRFQENPGGLLQEHERETGRFCGGQLAQETNPR